MANKSATAESYLSDQLTEAATAYAKALCDAAGGSLLPASLVAFGAGAGALAGAEIKTVVDFLVNSERIEAQYGLIAGSLGVGMMAILLLKPRRQNTKVERKRPD
jgi:hypothetical protein